jgi:hypothetical protein
MLGVSLKMSGGTADGKPSPTKLSSKRRGENLFDELVLGSCVRVPIALELVRQVALDVCIATSIVRM